MVSPSQSNGRRSTTWNDVEAASENVDEFGMYVDDGRFLVVPTGKYASKGPLCLAHAHRLLRPPQRQQLDTDHFRSSSF
jgi:hypothetical protein